MQAMCQLDVQGSEAMDSVERFIAENDSDDLVRTLAREWTKGAWQNLITCDAMIAQAAVKWKLSRLSMVDKNILRLSVYQLKYRKDIPPKVVINEAIEIAKKFSGAASAGFVNGVLDAINKKLENEKNSG